MSSSGPAGPGDPLPSSIVIPDDARDLELDRLQLERERAAARRRARLAKVFITRRWHRYGISGPIVVGCLLVVAVFATLLALLVPGGVTRERSAAPLADSTLAPGLIGSLLPSERLRGVGEAPADVMSRDMRPGVVLLVPASCDPDPGGACADAVRNVASAAKSYGLRTWLVGRPGITDLPSLAEAPQTAGTYSLPLLDSTGALFGAFQLRTTPTAVFLDPAGVVRGIVPGVTGDTATTPRLDQLTGYA